MPDPSGDRDLQGLLEALKATPGNAPLRRLVAFKRLERGEDELAEIDFKKVLQIDPDDLQAKLGLGRACSNQGKNAVAIVVLEDLLKHPDAPPEAETLLQSLVPADEAESAPNPAPSTGDSPMEPAEEIHADPSPTFVVHGKERQASSNPIEELLIEVQRPSTTFKDVGGMQDVKDEIRMKIILPLTQKDLYAAYDKKAGGGILLYGPPGCGKTHLARATAGEVKAGFLSVGLNDVLDMWIGQSEQKLHALFTQARRHRPSVLFIDEVDALGASRTDMRQSAGRQLINQFLSELDGIDTTNEGVLVLAATNAPWHLDSAFRRPGRFDRIIFVPPPDAPAREEILRLHLRDKPTEDIQIKKLAVRLEHYSGADLRALVDIAVESKLREAMKVGRPIPINTKDLASAARKVKPSTKEWLATARNYALYSNEGGVYDDILEYLDLK